MTTTDNVTITTPYASAWDTYWRHGWRGIIPLPAARKVPPPDGYTGYDGAYPSYADCHTWADTRPDANLALRLTPTIIGIDVDAYGGKQGAHTLTDLVTRYGPLPPTWMSTSRDDGISGIRLYAVPPNTRLVTALPGIEFIQYFHRYLVAWPSIHPDTGNTYQWVDEATGELGGLPDTNQLPELPDAWVTGLTATSERPTKTTNVDLRELLLSLPVGDPCPHVYRAAGKAMEGTARHDAYNSAVLTLLGAGRRGCPGSLQVLPRLRAAFIAEVTSDGTMTRSLAEATAEWERNITGAAAIVAAEPAGTGCPDNINDWVTDIPTPRPQSTDTADLTGGVWDYRIDWPVLLGAPPADPDWIVEGVIEQGRLVAVYSAAKAGKSLVALDIAASVALGKPCLGTPAVRPRHVLYCDFEMTPDEVADRIRDYGHDDPDTLNTYLHYLSLPSLPPMDSAEGGKALADAAAECGAELVIIDTTSRTIKGGENDSDTWHAWYRYTGMVLKQLGCTVVRLDHQGKDKDRGQRGSSAKVSDVDLVLRLTRISDETIILKREEARQAHYQEQVQIDVIVDGDGITRHRMNHTTSASTAVLDILALANTEGGIEPDRMGHGKIGYRKVAAFAAKHGIKAGRSDCTTAAAILTQQARSGQ